MPLEPGDHLAEESLRLLEVFLEICDTLLERARPLAMIGNLALLIKVPEKSHAAAPDSDSRESSGGALRSGWPLEDGKVNTFDHGTPETSGNSNGRPIACYRGEMWIRERRTKKTLVFRPFLLFPWRIELTPVTRESRPPRNQMVTQQPAIRWTMSRDQVFNYLRATTLEVGLLLNYEPRPTVKRYLCTNDRKIGLDLREGTVAPFLKPTDP